MLPFERVAHAAAARAGALLRARYRERHEVSFKGEVDLVTATDREAERLIVEAIAGAFPAHGIVAEESAPRPGRDGHRWYVDPLDGTTNFAHGYPHFCVSIALARDDDLLLGLVYDPIREETFSALRGEGARLNGAPIGVSDTRTLERALLGTGFPKIAASTRTSTSPSSPRRCAAPRGCGAAGRPRSTSATSPAGASTPSGSGSSTRGTRPPGGSSWRRRAGG